MKVICPKCYKVIEVTSKDETCFCSECGNNFSKEEGEKALNKSYKALQDLAYRYAYQTMEYDEAISCYKKALNLKNNDFSSIIGLILCTLNTGTFDKNEFSFVEECLEQFDVSLDRENTLLFLNFIDDVLSHLNHFYEEANARLFKDGKFLNEKYEMYYLKSVDDALNMLNYLQSGIDLCLQEEVEEFFKDDDVKEKLVKKIDELSALKEKKFEVLEESETLEDLRVIQVDENASKNLKMLSVYLLIALVLIVGICLLGNFVNKFIYIALILPVFLIVYVSLKYKKMTKK